MWRPSSSSMKLRSSSPRASSSGTARGLPSRSSGLRLLDQLDPLLFEQHQELVELFRVDGVVGKVIVDLARRSGSPFLARIEQGFQAFVNLLHQTPSSRPSGQCDSGSTGQRWQRASARPHGFTVGQLPEQFQGRLVVAGGLQLVMEFLSGRAGAASPRSGGAAGEARAARSGLHRPISCNLRACSARPGCPGGRVAGPGWAAHPPQSRVYSPSSSRRSPGWAISSGRTASAASGTRSGSANSSSSNCRSSGAAGAALRLGPLLGRPAPRNRVRRTAALFSQFVQSRP